ncbi:HAMP domain-containing sensor histidine kinase [Enterococcus sp. AZ196]|uniref:HAMP domain-containing sensor histidine kinase n=1 Tax=Enterococcus sp. AZ196 TaxID=2774659 RepID=UPI003D27ED1D
MAEQTRGNKWYSIYLINKKVFFLSKLVIGGCLLSYIISSAFGGWMRDIIFVVLLIVLIVSWDAILRKVVSRPVHEISEAAQRMADLDFSQPCKIHTNDELGTLANNLNKTARNLTHALEQRKDLADTLSHELKTPLGVIRAYSEGLGEATPEQEESYRQTIIEETEKMAEMINDLLDLSALEAGSTSLSVESFDLVELVEAIAGREFIDSRTTYFELSYSLPEQPIFIIADQKRMRQVLHNFMSNAKKFVTDSGKIHIELTTLKGNAHFLIYNDGPNVSSDSWNKFQRSKGEENKSGSGLGLTIAAQILTMHQADFGFNNRTAGVEFYFSLPIDNNQ